MARLTSSRENWKPVSPPALGFWVDCMHIFSVEINLPVLCSVRPGWSVRRRLGWCHPLHPQRQRRMRFGLRMRWCGWVIARCERPQVKILTWRWDAFINVKTPLYPSPFCYPAPLLLSFNLSVCHKTPFWNCLSVSICTFLFSCAIVMSALAF